MLIEHTLWGKRDKVEIAIQRLRVHHPAEGYYLAFSGGKDSVVIKALAKMARVQFTANYNRTTVDPPEVEAFIRQWHEDVVWHRPERSMFRLILDKQWPPMRQQRWCCEMLKESNGNGIVVTGVRWAESSRRRQRRMLEACYKDSKKVYFHPIIDWTDRDVWEFIEVYGLRYCELYDEGFDRLGCILCPMSRNPERDIKRWPKFARAYIRTFDRLLEVRAAAGKNTSFETGQDMFEWWITRNSKPVSADQMTLF